MRTRIALMLLAGTLSAGCSTTGSNTTGATVDHMERNGVDMEYVQAVERVARRRGVDVVWVDPPKKADDDS